MTKLCRKIENLSGENPGDTRKRFDREQELAEHIAYRDVLHYLEEEAYCKNLSPLEAALVEDSIFSDMWGLRMQQTVISDSSEVHTQATVLALDADVAVRLERIGVSTDDSLQHAVQTFTEVLDKVGFPALPHEQAPEPAVSILDKFEAVEITNDSRITAEELAYCTAQQALYVAMLKQHRHVYGSLKELNSECVAFLKSVEADNIYDSSNYPLTHYDCCYVKLSKEDFACKHIDEIHNKFVLIIMEHFINKYHVDIEVPEWTTFFAFEEPSEPSCPYSHLRFREVAEEIKDEYDAALKAYEVEKEAYWDAIISFELDYNLLLDHIFVALDGDTFAERAEQEIKEGSREASHDYGKSNYELKNKKLAFKILRVSKSYVREEYEVTLNDNKYISILRALTYFDSGKQETDTYSGWHRFIGYSQSERDGIFATHSVFGNKVEAFRYLKNKKFEVTFTSHSAANRFAVEYLYPEDGGEDD